MRPEGESSNATHCIASHRITAQQQVRHHVLDLPVGMAYALRYGANKFGLDLAFFNPHDTT